jgi:hypothetical protein
MALRRKSAPQRQKCGAAYNGKSGGRGKKALCGGVARRKSSGGNAAALALAWRGVRA